MAKQSSNGLPERDSSDKDDEPATATRPPEFERFDALTRKLVQVPKKELDEKRKAKR